jgi:Na+-transporting methylmalonyl-CoA/oxaloacetate decarboxylase beta subunit
MIDRNDIRMRVIKMLLLSAAVICIALYLIITYHMTQSTHIIGGADSPTYLYLVVCYIRTPVGSCLAAITTISLLMYIIVSLNDKKKR